MKSLIVAFFVLFALLSTVNAAEGSEVPLRVEDVLASSATHYPRILESLAERRAAEGGALAALGAFDLVFEADGFSRATGFWDGSVVNTQVSRNLRALGANVYGGYRISDGAFPVYEDINFTNTGGEAKIGVIFSLLRDRAIDDRRYGVAIAELDFQQADLEVLLTQIGVQHRAQVAYWRWLAAGRALEIYEQLLKIAKDRQVGLEQEVRLGARAAIFLTENQQNITRREILVAEAARDFRTTANNLSMYYRDDAGDRIIPARAQLPAEMNAPPVTADSSAEESAALEALRNRPELRILSVQLEQARQSIALGRNELKPRLEMRYELSRDFGDIAEGGSSRDSTDNIVGLRFSVPFQRRNARGAIRKAEAERDALLQRRRQTGDQIEVEIRNILLDLDAGRVLTNLAAREVEQADIMQRAERERFASGASDFFLVNLREERAANARIRYYRAALDARVADANFSAATVDIEQLGLTNAPAQ